MTPDSSNIMPVGAGSAMYRNSDVPPRHAETPARELTAQMIAVDIRCQAVTRMCDMSYRHAQAAWDRRRCDPLAAYALAFLFVQRSPEGTYPYPYRLTAATKLWLAGPENQDLPQLLFRYLDSLANTIPAIGFDVRDLADRCDEGMAGGAEYAGLGVSSLDTYSGSWDQVAGRASSAQDIAGCVRIVMTDATVITVERRGMDEFNAVNITATQSLEYVPGNDPYPWTRAVAHQIYADPLHEQPLRFMTALHDVLWQADRDRVKTARAHTAHTARRAKP